MAPRERRDAPADPRAKELRAITLLALAGFASTSSFRVCDPMLPLLAQSFGVSTGEAAGVVTVFALAYGTLQLVYGPLGDRHGKFRVLSIATLACFVGCLGAAMAGSFASLLFWRVLSGATAAGIVPLSMAWIGDNIPYERRQATLARYLTGTILGMGAGQVIGGVFADTLGWRIAFLVLAVLYLAVGSLLVAELRRGGARSAAGGAGGAGASGAHPSFASRVRDVLALPWARRVLLVVGIEGTLVLGALAFVPAHIHFRHGLSMTLAGATGAAYGVGGLAYSFVAHRLVARWGERGLAGRGGAVLAAAFAVLGLAPTWHWALLACIALGLGFYMVHNTLQTHATQMAPGARGTAVALFASMLFLGQSLGVWLGGIVVDRLGTAWLFGACALGLPVLAAWFAAMLGGRERRARA